MIETFMRIEKRGFLYECRHQITKTEHANHDSFSLDIESTIWNSAGLFDWLFDKVMSERVELEVIVEFSAGNVLVWVVGTDFSKNSKVKLENVEKDLQNNDKLKILLSELRAKYKWDIGFYSTFHMKKFGKEITHNFQAHPYFLLYI